MSALKMSILEIIKSQLQRHPKIVGIALLDTAIIVRNCVTLTRILSFHHSLEVVNAVYQKLMEYPATT
jgi:hypothetical protein